MDESSSDSGLQIGNTLCGQTELDVKVYLFLTCNLLCLFAKERPPRLVPLAETKTNGVCVRRLSGAAGTGHRHCSRSITPAETSERDNKVNLTQPNQTQTPRLKAKSDNR